ncbi:agmatine deiminase family protein [uncultured Muribaculum sp.]|uniref:agmatine deiminase family protein n=1 Tax=uncultured Muribaculum sp. TaxID=1918613 RepID=UPI0025976D92|nr:agmatine deiminase family protein [uncultured Muribaculum sp.]
MMNESEISRRLPAEWEPQGGVIVSWPHSGTDWAYMLDEVTKCFADIVAAIAQEQPVVVITPDKEIAAKHLIDANQDNIIYAELPTNDTWARDFGPITVTEGEVPLLLDFGFNGWGLKFASDKDNLLTKGLVELGVLRARCENCRGFILEGGSIESDGRGTLLTTSRCLLSPNRNPEMSRSRIEEYLKAKLGVEQVLWLDHGYLAGDDTDSHIDTLARLAPHDTIIYVGCNDAADEHYEELQAMKRQLMEMRTLDGAPYNLIELPMPDAIYDEDGERLPATYANFLVMNKSVLLPVYGQPMNDELAAQMLKISFPDHEIRKIDCRPLIKQHGSLHCVTMQIPNEILPI